MGEDWLYGFDDIHQSVAGRDDIPRTMETGKDEDKKGVHMSRDSSGFWDITFYLAEGCSCDLSERVLSVAVLGEAAAKR